MRRRCAAGEFRLGLFAEVGAVEAVIGFRGHGARSARKQKGKGERFERMGLAEAG